MDGQVHKNNLKTAHLNTKLFEIWTLISSNGRYSDSEYLNNLKMQLEA